MWYVGVKNVENVETEERLGCLHICNPLKVGILH